MGSDVVEVTYFPCPRHSEDLGQTGGASPSCRGREWDASSLLLRSRMICFVVIPRSRSFVSIIVGTTNGRGPKPMGAGNRHSRVLIGSRRQFKFTTTRYSRIMRREPRPPFSYSAVPSHTNNTSGETMVQSGHLFGTVQSSTTSLGC